MSVKSFSLKTMDLEEIPTSSIYCWSSSDLVLLANWITYALNDRGLQQPILDSVVKKPETAIH